VITSVARCGTSTILELLPQRVAAQLWFGVRHGCEGRLKELVNVATSVLGISGFYHDSAAALVVDAKVVAAAQEERFSRKKHDARFPTQAIESCLSIGGRELSQIDLIVFYDKPLLKFERILETYLQVAPKGFTSFLYSMPLWIKDKLFLKQQLKKKLAQLGNLKVRDLPRLVFAEHHQSHAASAYFPSPYNKAAVLCLDGVGEWATTSVWLGEGNTLTPQWQINFPHSIGLLYSAFTYFCGFKVNSGEYKLMGLAPYGEPVYADVIRRHLVKIREDGTFALNMDYFGFTAGLKMTNQKFADLFGGPPRHSEAAITQREMDLARSIQEVTEEVVLKLGRAVRSELGVENLCLAGGVALNCVANGALARSGIFKSIWIQPAAGDAGGALGAALSGYYQYLGHSRAESSPDSMQGSFLGPAVESVSAQTYFSSIKAPYRKLDDAALLAEVASHLANGKIVGWVQGRMEFGPRSLGGRSILGDPRNETMQSTMNLKIKFRESFRPFAPSVLADKAADYFELDGPSPYMLLVAPVKQSRRVPCKTPSADLFGLDKLKLKRSELPAVTHVDFSARIQTVHPESNPRYYALIQAFEKLSGCPVVVNTSFNVRGEPIVCDHVDAYRCFMRSDIDYLVVEDLVLAKSEQPAREADLAWRREFELD
jgi:carbamoyltransferase